MILEAKMLKKKYVWACCDQYCQMLKEHSIIKQQNELIQMFFHVLVCIKTPQMILCPS